MASAEPNGDNAAVVEQVVMDVKSPADTHGETPLSVKSTAQDAESQAKTTETVVPLTAETLTLEKKAKRNTLFDEKELAQGKEAQLSGRLSTASAAVHIPIEILQKILFLVDSETFASATLVDRNWRSATNDAKLYTHHLSRSPSCSPQDGVVAESSDDASLPELKRSFAQEIKRCLYTPFLHPRVTIVNLISETPLSSFAAGPGGEKFDFTFSQYGRWCLAISSSRIYVVDLNGTPSRTIGPSIEPSTQEDEPEAISIEVEPSEKAKGKQVEHSRNVSSPGILQVTKELKVVRRPLGADILANGSVLAVLSSDHQVSLYNVLEDKVELRRTVDLDNPPYAIAMSPGGEILAAAFDGGMELCSLREGASPSERRTVKCHRVDRLMFSSDGSMLLGTTSTKDPATVILSAPYFNAMEHDLTQAELVNSMWTQQILFPSSSRDCSHSTLLPRYGDENSNWTLTYDRTYESFRAVRTDDLRNGTTYFTGPQTGTDRRVQWPKDALVPSSLPSTTAKGDLVAAGFKGSEIWLYGVPENLDATANLQLPINEPSASNETAVSPETSDENAEAESKDKDCERPRWQMLVDKYRNVFSKGKKVADVPGVTGMCWFKRAQEDESASVHTISERLIVSAPGGVGSDFILDEETPIEGGRLVVLDFNLEPHDGVVEEIIIELGKKEPLLLEEQKTDMEAEIAKARRRTMATRDAARVRSVIDALRPNNDLEDIPDVPEVPGSLGYGMDAPHGTGDHPDVSDDDEPGVSVEEAAAFAEGPYSHTNPRSRTALYRSATISAASRQRIPPQPRHQDQPPQPVFRRTDGTEVPDESDADNWQPPPPPYQRYVDEQLPDDLVQRALLYNGIAPIPNTFDALMRPRRSSSVNTDNRSSHRRRSSVDTDVLAHHLRPSRPGEDVFRPGDTITVASTTVTPRSSIRRRPLTTYTSSSSVALRESNTALRDSNIARPISHLTRSSSLSSGNIRLSRSESLRRTSQAGSNNLALSPPQTNLHDQANWPLPAPQEQPEPVSPPEEADDPLATVAVEPAQLPAERSEGLLGESRDDFSQPSPASDLPPSDLPVSPEEKVVHVPPSDGDEDISPRAIAPPDLPVAAWIDTPPQRDSPPAQQPTTLPEVQAPVPVSSPDMTRPREDSATILPPVQALPHVPAESSTTVPQSQEYFPPSPPSPEESRQAPARQHQGNEVSNIITSPQTLSPEPQPRVPAQTSASPISPESIPSPPAPSIQTQLHTQTLPSPPAPRMPTEPVLESASVPEPSAFQLSNLQTRPRPHARQLSGSTHRGAEISSQSPATAYSYTAYSPAFASSSTAPGTPANELATDTSSIKSRKRKNRLSQRIKGAFRRTEPEEPMPELPIVPQMPGLVGPAQPSPTTSGPARHSRLYADNRNNASEPALRRPPAQRMDTIQSVGSTLGRIPSVRRGGAQTPDPATPLQMPVVAETAAQPQQGHTSRRPTTKRSRSIFGGRRRSQVGTAVVQNEAMPPVPPVPVALAGPYGSSTAAPPGMRAASPMMHPGAINRAATAEPSGYFPGTQGQAVQTEITGGRKKKKDKDGKCSVM